MDLVTDDKVSGRRCVVCVNSSGIVSQHVVYMSVALMLTGWLHFKQALFCLYHIIKFNMFYIMICELKYLQGSCRIKLLFFHIN